jgi:hypothetical protein
MRCENPLCGELLTADHVLLATTCHVRRFCTVECIAESKMFHEDAIAASEGLTLSADERLGRQLLRMHPELWQ